MPKPHPTRFNVRERVTESTGIAPNRVGPTGSRRTVPWRRCAVRREMTRRRLELDRSQILAFRRTVQHLDKRLPPGPDSLRRAAWAGLQDSMPRAAVLSIHARVEGTQSNAWEDPSLIQLWGPRFSAYVVAASDLAVFSLSRLPDPGAGRRKAEDLAARLHTFLDGRTMPFGQAGRGMGESPNQLRSAAPTGTVRTGWEVARQPTIWMVPAPEMDPFEARL